MLSSALLVIALAAAPSADPKDTPAEKLELLWPTPSRAMVGIENNFQFVVLNPRLEALTWKLDNAPEGMVVKEGRLTWTPAKAQVVKDIKLTVSGSGGSKVERVFDVNANTTDFVLVAPKDADLSGKTVPAKRVETLEEALAITAKDGAKTILLHGAVYTRKNKWEGGNHPLRGSRFTAESPVEIRPLDPANPPVMKCVKTDGVVFFQTAFVILDGITVEGAEVSERGGITVNESHHILISNATVVKTTGDFRNNPTGFLIGSGSNDVILFRCTAEDNGDPNSESWNSSNYLVYNSGREGRNVIVQCVSRRSRVGFKIKHSGDKVLVLERCESYSDGYGYAGASKGSIIRGCVAWRCDVGIQVGITDPKEGYTEGGMVIESCAFLFCGGHALHIQDDYAKKEKTIVRRCLFVTDKKAGGGEMDNRHAAIQIYSVVTSKSCPVEMRKNFHHAPSGESLFRVGKGEGRNTDLKGLGEKGFDYGSRFGDAKLEKASDGLLNPASRGSPLEIPDDDVGFVGPVRPGQTLQLVPRRR